MFMSESTKEVRRQITSKMEQLDKHLLTLILFPDCNSKKHWMTGVYTFLNSVDKLKNRRKWPPYKCIREATSVHEDMLDVYIYIKQVKSRVQEHEGRRRSF